MNKPRVPTVEEYVLKALLTPMREAEKRRLDKMLISLNRRNKEITKANHDGFLHNGVYEIPITISTIRPVLGQRTSLDFSLWNEIEELRADRNATAIDLKIIEQLLYKMTVNCQGWQDIRDSLPDFMAGYIKETRVLTRQKPELYSIRNDARALRQFENTKEKMALYLAGNLMY